MASMSDAERGCFFAFVDRRSYDLVLSENREVKSHPAAAASGRPAVGVWQLVLLEGQMPFASARRNSRVPKMLAHRLFPTARWRDWVTAV